MEFRFQDRPHLSLAPIPGPPGVDGGYFVLWAPNDVGGTIRAPDADGSAIAEHELHLRAIGLEWNANVITAYGGP